MFVVQLDKVDGEFHVWLAIIVVVLWLLSMWDHLWMIVDWLVSYNMYNLIASVLLIISQNNNDNDDNNITINCI